MPGDFVIPARVSAGVLARLIEAFVCIAASPKRVVNERLAAVRAAQ